MTQTTPVLLSGLHSCLLMLALVALAWCAVVALINSTRRPPTAPPPPRVWTAETAVDRRQARRP